jgi:replicative DNA helicase
VQKRRDGERVVKQAGGRARAERGGRDLSGRFESPAAAPASDQQTVGVSAGEVSGSSTHASPSSIPAGQLALSASSPPAPSRTRTRTRTTEEEKSAHPDGAPSAGGRKETNPGIKVVIGAFVAAHQKYLGTPYVVHGGRDGAALKRLLTQYSLNQVLACLPAYFADRKGIERLGAHIHLFAGRVATCGPRGSTPMRAKGISRSGPGGDLGAALDEGRRAVMKHVDADLERALLSFFLVHPQRLFESEVRAEHFAPGLHQTVFRAVTELALQGAERIDLPLLRARIIEQGPDVSLTWLSEVYALDAVDGGGLAQQLRQTWLKRHVHNQLQQVARQLADAAADPREVVADAVEQLTAALHGTESTALYRYTDMLSQRAAEILRREHGVGDAVPTGFPSLDRAIGGLPREGLTICGGRTSRGKSVLLQQTCEQVAARGGRVLLSTPEMSWGDVADRGLARRLRIDLRNLRERNLTPAEEAQLAAPLSFPASFFVYDARPQTTRDIARVARRVALAGPIDVIAVDYVQYLNDALRKNEPRYQQIDRIVRALRDLAAQLHTAVLVGAQLNRMSDTRQPQLHNLRESGDLEQNADVVILLGGNADDAVTLFIAKQRNGPRGQVTLGFERPYTRLIDPRWTPRATRGYGPAHPGRHGAGGAVTLAALLADCDARGIVLGAYGDRLQYRAPHGALTPELRAALVDHKAELVAMLASPLDRVERAESDLLGLPKTGLLRVQQHAHACTSCSRRFRCTTPSCAGQPKRCVCCTLDAIGGRGR